MAKYRPKPGDLFTTDWDDWLCVYRCESASPIGISLLSLCSPDAPCNEGQSLYFIHPPIPGWNDRWKFTKLGRDPLCPR